MRLKMYHDGGQYQSSADTAGRGRGGRGRGYGNRGRSSGGRGGQNYNSKQKGSSTKPICQICKKEGHEAPRCWYRYDEDEEDDQHNKTAGAATTDYGYDTNWYVDSGATHHMIGELEKLSVRDKYNGCDQVHTASA
jgi:hypothetical protein